MLAWKTAHLRCYESSLLKSAIPRTQIASIRLRRLSVSCGGLPRPRTPLIDALLRYKKRSITSFHIPGHKRGKGVYPELLQLIDQESILSDLTELPGLDNLASPTGPIAESQNLAAQAFGADQTWYLVNGTTVGLQAAIIATCSPGDGLVIARNCHVSCFSGMVLADAVPVWVNPCMHPLTDAPACISPEALEAGFQAAKQQGVAPKAALVVSPTYFGACCDIQGLADVCHKHKAPLLVDAAHGAHHSLQPGFPDSALRQGADIVVQSTHKTLSSLGQSSMLHCRGPRVSHSRISSALKLLQTTSPSYLLLASLDAAQAHAHALLQGPASSPLSAIASARQQLSQLPKVKLLQDCSQGCAVKEFDPWRITLVANELGKTGFELETILQDEYSIYPEMATHKVVVFAIGPGSCRQDLDKLVASVSQMCQSIAAQSNPELEVPRFQPAQQEWPHLSPRTAFFASKEMIPYEEAAGLISGDVICPYPPGTPVAFPGERLTKDIIELLGSTLRAGGVVTSSTDPALKRVRVIKASGAD